MCQMKSARGFLRAVNGLFVLWLVVVLGMAVIRTDQVAVAEVLLALTALGSWLGSSLLWCRYRVWDGWRLVWCGLAWLALWGVAHWQEMRLRAQADAMVVCIKQWQARHQRFPRYLGELGGLECKQTPRPGELAEIRYRLSEGGRPLLFYQGVGWMAQSWVYDFGQGWWRAWPVEDFSDSLH